MSRGGFCRNHRGWFVNPQKSGVAWFGVGETVCSGTGSNNSYFLATLVLEKVNWVSHEVCTLWLSKEGRSQKPQVVEPEPVHPRCTSVCD